MIFASSGIVGRNLSRLGKAELGRHSEIRYLCLHPKPTHDHEPMTMALVVCRFRILNKTTTRGVLRNAMPWIGAGYTTSCPCGPGESLPLPIAQSKGPNA
nr:hypothetical protein CFP56_41460 [Quercus suber]